MRGDDGDDIVRPPVDILIRRTRGCDLEEDGMKTETQDAQTELGEIFAAALSMQTVISNVPRRHGGQRL